MTLPSAAVMVSSGPIGAAPCETHGSISTPSKRTPTAPAVDAPRRRGTARAPPRPSARRRGRRAAGASACARTGSAGPGRWGRCTGRRAGPRRRRRRGRACPVSAPPPSSSSGSTVAWNAPAAPSPRRRRPHRHARCPPRPPGRRRARRRRRSRSAVRARAPRGRAASVASGAARCVPEANTTARSQPPPRSPARAAARGRLGAGDGIGQRGQAGADADGHHGVTILPPRPCSAVPAPVVVAIFGPTGRRQDATWRSRWPSACAPRARTRSPCRPTRCRSTAGSRP